MNVGSRGQYQKIFFMMNPNAIHFQFSPPLTLPYWHLALFRGMQLCWAKRLMIILIFREWQYSAYRSYIHSIFGGLGRMQRKVIPACVVVAI